MMLSIVLHQYKVWWWFWCVHPATFSNQSITRVQQSVSCDRHWTATVTPINLDGVSGSMQFIMESLWRECDTDGAPSNPVLYCYCAAQCWAVRQGAGLYNKDKQINELNPKSHTLKACVTFEEVHNADCKSIHLRYTVSFF